MSLWANLAAITTAWGFAPPADRVVLLTSNWIGGGGDDACMVIRGDAQAGETQLVLRGTEDDAVSLSVFKKGWSARKGDLYQGTVTIDGIDGAAQMRGLDVGDRRGFLIGIDWDIVERIARASSISFSIGETPITTLSLTGSANAIAYLRSCLAGIPADKAAQRRAARSALPAADPFAEVTGGLGAVTPPRPKGDPASWVAPDFYPAGARSRRAEGKVGATLAVDVEGRISACQITRSSGDVDLDNATCRIVRSLGRFDPAKQSDGKVLPGTWSGEWVWRLGDGGR